MSNSDRTPSQKAKHLEQIARSYLQGRSQAATAIELGIDQSTVSRDLKELREIWRESAIRDFDTHKAEQLARIDALEAEYWTAWGRSLTIKETTVLESVSGEKGDSTKTVTKREAMCGNAAYLAGIERCIAERSKLLDLYSPVYTASDLASKVISSGITPEAFIGELRKQWALEG